jgi:hypothetical protein
MLGERLRRIQGKYRKPLQNEKFNKTKYNGVSIIDKVKLKRNQN